jgi:hypothetical protein
LAAGDDDGGGSGTNRMPAAAAVFLEGRLAPDSGSSEGDDAAPWLPLYACTRDRQQRL